MLSTALEQPICSSMMTTVRTYLEATPELGEIRICTYDVNGGELKQVAIKGAQRLQLIKQRRERSIRQPPSSPWLSATCSIRTTTAISSRPKVAVSARPWPVSIDRHFTCSRRLPKTVPRAEGPGTVP